MEYPKFKVCVRCITFNQSKYITDAMNGFTMQQTDFPFVCCIIDDASTDGEQEVIRKYVEDNFDLSENSCHFERETDYAFITYAQHKVNKNCYFAVLYLKENLYSKKEGYKKVQYISEWRSGCEYEALCEGDDYWIDKNKLIYQVNFLDANQEYGLCYTQCRYYYQNENEYMVKPWGGKSETFSEFMILNTVPTLTVLLRLELETKYQNEIKPAEKHWMMGDYPRWIWFSHESKIKFLPITTGVYRVLASSASHYDDIDKRIRFIESSIGIRAFFEQYFNIAPNTFVGRDELAKHKLYLYAVNHEYGSFFGTLMKNKKLMLNIRVLGFVRHFLTPKKCSYKI